VTWPHDDVATLTAALTEAVARGDDLDAFLAAAAMRQIAEDAIDGEPALLLHAAGRFASGGGWPGRGAAATARAAARRAGDVTARRRPPALHVWGAAVSEAVALLAERVAGDAVAEPRPDEPPPAERGSGDAVAEPRPDEALHAVVRAVRESAARLPDPVRRTVARTPACFRTFDQHPDDVRELVARFARLQPERDRPLLVAGVRTSGVYLAPLAAAALRATGYRDVRVITLRPHRRLRADQRAAVRSVAARGGLGLVCDDPPATGGAVGAVARDLARRGLDVVLLLAVFGDRAALPPRLRDFRFVLLPEPDWAVSARVEPARVRAAVAALLAPGADVVACEPLTAASRPQERGPVRRAYRIGIRVADTGIGRSMTIAAEGVGLGRLGAHALAVHGALAPFLPAVLGVRDGLLYREWLPADHRVDRTAAGDPDTVAERLAAYVDARARALELPRDHTLAARGERPAWELAGLLLAGAFGPAEPVARVVLVDPAVRRVLRVGRPAEIDGSMDLTRWFSGAGGELLKVDWAQPSDASFRVGSCDPVCDLAQVTARSQDRALARGLRRAYAAAGHDAVDPERWLLYELAHLQGPGGTAASDPDVRAACARAMRAYYHEVFFADLRPPTDGPLWGIDVDGVLELEAAGFPALTPASATALRALTVHGHRPLLVTGRSAADVAERCASYRLAGGVAEYGAVVHVADGATAGLVSVAEAIVLERVRRALQGTDGVHVEPGYRHAVRAFALDARGRHRPPPDAAIGAALRKAGATDVHAIRGDGQTDLVVGRVDKGVGVRALLERLGVEPGAPRPLHVAVGDTAADAPLLQLAIRPYVPGHAARRLRPLARVTHGAYAAGFAEAVGEVLGHAPGSCPECRVADGGEARQALLALLGLREGGLRGVPAHALAVARAQ
jgi:hydroxymethylpyrimidine pyrophosphatase-like HAD family hydrolase